MYYHSQTGLVVYSGSLEHVVDQKYNIGWLPVVFLLVYVSIFAALAAYMHDFSFVRSRYRRQTQHASIHHRGPDARCTPVPSSLTATTSSCLSNLFASLRGTGTTTLQAAYERLEEVLYGMYARVRELEREVQIGRRNEQSLRMSLGVVVGEKDSLRTECEGLYEKIREEKRSARSAETSYQTSLREQSIAVATLHQAKTQLEGIEVPV